MPSPYIRPILLCLISAAGFEQMVDNKWVPLNRGKIALQLEYAEVCYRKVEIKE